VSLATALRQSEARARENSAFAHVLDADAIQHLARLFEAPSADEGMAVEVVQRWTRGPTSEESEHSAEH